MNVNKMEKLKTDAELKAYNIGRLLKDKQSVDQSIIDLNRLRNSGGIMDLTAYSGTTGRTEKNMRKISVNSLAGSEALLDFLEEMANERLLDLDAKALILEAQS